MNEFINFVQNGIKRNPKLTLLWAGFLLVYVPVFIEMWGRWFARDSYYSHGILIPFVTAYLIAQKIPELKKLKMESSPLGIVLIIVGIVLSLLSSFFRVNFTAGFSMLIVLFGLVLQFYGVKILRVIFFPLFFLVFMVPLPEVVVANLSFRLKLFAASIAAAILKGMGFLAIQEGSIIKMRNAYVIVDDVCSGLRSLISLTALGSIFAYWMKGPMWKRLLLFLTTIPIAVITNVVRVIFLSCISEIWGPEYAGGFVHDATGFLVFALAFILLYAMGKLIE